MGTIGEELKQVLECWVGWEVMRLREDGEMVGGVCVCRGRELNLPVRHTAEGQDDCVFS